MASPQFRIGRGACCSVLWRHIHHHEEYIALDRDARYSAKKPVMRSDLERRTSTICRNTFCAFRVHVSHGFPSVVPPIHMPKSQDGVNAEMPNPYPRIFQGLFYGQLHATHCRHSSSERSCRPTDAVRPEH
ncbi:hypothetical protein BDR03DRAFT_76375 [Suillus americanus]|nr:hypothetical protein BDR03DRAFT_76375 [Suillus americanus]